MTDPFGCVTFLVSEAIERKAVATAAFSEMNHYQKLRLQPAAVGNPEGCVCQVLQSCRSFNPVCNIFVCACSFKAFSVCSLKPWEDGGHEGVSEKWKEKAFRPGHFFSRYVLLSCFYFVMFGLCTVLLAFHDIKCSCQRQRGRTDGVRGTDICFSRGSTRDQLRRFLDHRCLPLRFVSPLGLNKKSRETQQLVW